MSDEPVEQAAGAGRGSIIVNGRVFQITDMVLAGGQIRLTGMLPGPAERVLPDIYTYRVHGGDGTLIVMGRLRFECPGFGADECGLLTVHLEMHTGVPGGEHRAFSMPADGTLP